MKTIFVLGLLFSLVTLADTPAPGTVKAKTYSGDGNTAIGAVGDSLKVNITNSGGFTTVNQGTAGLDPWFVSVRNSAPLPVNACQETGGNLAAILSALQSPLAVTGTFWQATQPVSAASLPLPSGAATSAKQPALGTAGTSSSDVLSVQGVTGMTALKVDGSAVTQPVSGTVTANAGTGTFLVDGSGHTQPVSGTFWQATQPVSLASIPLASGAATEGTQLDVMDNTANTATSVASIDTKTPALGQALAAGSVPVVLTAAQVTTLTPPTTITANAGSGTFAVSAASLPLPSGASTAAKQPALGTAGSPSSDVITVQGVTSMTALKVDGSAVTQPVSGTVTANAGSGTFTVDASGHTVPVSGTFWQATQPVSGTVTANIGTSGSLALNSTVAGLQVAQGSTTSGQSGSLSLGAVTTSGPTYTTGQSSPFSLTTAGALRIDGSAATQPVSGTFWQATQPVSLSTLPALTAGSAIIGKVGIDQTTPGTTNGVQVNAALPAGTNVIGKVSIDQTTPGTTNLVALAANQSVNLSQVAGTTTSTGNGTVDAGTQRVAIASNNTAFSVNATPVVPAATTVKQAAITVGTSAVRLTTDAGAPSSTRTLLVAQLLSTSTANCFFGSSGVTTTSTTRGVQMFAGQTLSFNNDAGDYYAICDASSQTIFITEQE